MVKRRFLTSNIDLSDQLSGASVPSSLDFELEVITDPIYPICGYTRQTRQNGNHDPLSGRDPVCCARVCYAPTTFQELMNEVVAPHLLHSCWCT